MNLVQKKSQLGVCLTLKNLEPNSKKAENTLESCRSCSNRELELRTYGGFCKPEVMKTCLFPSEMQIVDTLA